MTIDIIFFIGRIILGGYFLYNAYNHFAHVKMLTGYAKSKGVPAPELAVVATGVMLAVGGAGIILGLGVKIALILLLAFMAGTTAMMHAFWKIKDPAARMPEMISFMKNTAIFGALLMIFALWVGM